MCDFFRETVRKIEPQWLPCALKRPEWGKYDQRHYEGDQGDGETPHWDLEEKMKITTHPSNQSAYLHHHIKVTPTLNHFFLGEGDWCHRLCVIRSFRLSSMKRNAAMRTIIVNFVKMTISNSLETPQTSVSKNFHPKSALQRRRCCWLVNRFFVVVKGRLKAYKYLSFKDRPWLQPLN